MKFLLPAFIIATSGAAAEPEGVKPSAAEQWEAAYQSTRLPITAHRSSLNSHALRMIPDAYPLTDADGLH